MNKMSWGEAYLVAVEDLKNQFSITAFLKSLRVPQLVIVMHKDRPLLEAFSPWSAIR